MSELSNVWNQVEALLSQNISIIPVREKDEPYKDSIRPAKTPYAGWKTYQTNIIGKDDLWRQMEKFNTSAIAIVCGKVSGGIEVIDIDVKYNPGIDAILFTDIQKLYPDLLPKLRIHKTPSGGYHIIYRMVGTVPGNEKLAGRPATDDELSAKPKNKTYNFLETRGEGGYIVAPPSLGYSIHQFQPIPLLTYEERCSLINLCKQYNQIVKVVKEVRKYDKEDSKYSENPFEHYNSSNDGQDVLLSNGWEEYDTTGTHVYYTRPGRDKAGISASFSKSHRLFYFFTTSTEFDEKTWYSPATVLSKLLHADDKKKTFAYLINRGYGVLKPSYEKQIAKHAAHYGGRLPENISEEAKQLYQDEKASYTEQYPHGIFWQEDEEGIKISREKLYRVSEALGFRLNEQNPNEICFINGYIVQKVTDRKYFDTLRQYIKEEDADQYELIFNAYEAFIQKSGTFTISRLPLLSHDLFLQSNKTTSYKFYKNCFISIASDGVTEHKYEELNKFVWESQINQRNFKTVAIDVLKQSLYFQFLSKAIGISKDLQRAIGYLSHDFKDEEMGYIIVLVEQCPDPKQGGGSGKNVFSSLFESITTYKNIPGSQVQYNEKFLQAWNFERIFSISDVPKKFDFTFLKELSTGSGILKKLFQNEVSIDPSQMPKLIVSTNFSYEVSDGGLKRRIIPIEFTDFFTKSGGVNTYFNAMFPKDWDDDEWHAYDTFIAGCIQSYLANNGKLTAPELTETGRQKQFEFTYGMLTRQFIDENFEEWCRVGEVEIEHFNNQYETFCRENGLNIKFKLSSQIMNRALEDYCKEKNVEFVKSEQRKLNGVVKKYKMFGKYVNGENAPF